MCFILVLKPLLPVMVVVLRGALSLPETLPSPSRCWRRSDAPCRRTVPGSTGERSWGRSGWACALVGAPAWPPLATDLKQSRQALLLPRYSPPGAGC